MNETGGKELDPGVDPGMPGMEADPSAMMATMGAGEGESGWTGESGGGGLAAAADEAGPINIDLIMDLPLQVVVELGRTTMLINDLLQLGQGSVIELNKQVGEPLDILVNGKLVARGEVVVVRDKFGIRITDVISPIERIKQLA
ncbi:MAG: flagellar motor switch protein FliN [Candidatus Tectomicrobia bacterium]|nr:flagellar motor switch protein FliN [Candidatus Tectomicrobia bacterium]